MAVGCAAVATLVEGILVYKDKRVGCKAYDSLAYGQEAGLCYKLDKARKRLSLPQPTNNTALRFARVILEKHNGQCGGRKLPYRPKGQAWCYARHNDLTFGQTGQAYFMV